MFGLPPIHSRTSAAAELQAARFDLSTGRLIGMDLSDPHVWGLSGDDAQRLAAAIRRGDDPGHCSHAPWVVAARRPDGSVVLAASATAEAGACWTVERSPKGRLELLCGPDIGAVVRSRSAVTELAGDYLRGRLTGIPETDATTPYRDVHNLRPGHTAVWRAGSAEPDVVAWLSPQTLPPPTLEGPGTRDTYLRTFDAAVDDLIVPGEPICATLSGGLDSTFVVASLVRHATPGNPVHCFSHSPHPDAGLAPRGNWDPDDYDVARAMERAYPGRVSITRVVNNPPVNPLDLFAWLGVRSWAPPSNVNGSWFASMAARAHGLGASRLFQGTNGNAAFSFGHPYAAGYYLRRGRLLALASLARPRGDHGQTVTKAAATAIVGPLTARWRHRGGSFHADYLTHIGLGRLRDSAPKGRTASANHSRDSYLEWLLGAHLPAWIASPLTWDTNLVDPFRARSVIELAASITPREWNRGPRPRGYARLLGEGRVPDEIRLRTRRGAQSADLWFAMKDHRDRYLDEIALLPDTEFLGGWVDAEHLRRTVADWPWGQSTGPSGMGIAGVHGVLGLAGFIRMTRRRLRALALAGGHQAEIGVPLR